MNVQIAPIERALPTADPALYAQSSLREKLIEHVFVGALLKALWRRGARDIEVLRAEVDMGGYDLVLECNGNMRHIQFKSSYSKARTAETTVNLKLADKPSGCVIWIWFDQQTLELGPFLWLGGAPGEKLPQLGDRVGRHTKGNKTGHKAARTGHRVVAKSRFIVLRTIEQVDRALFGTV